MAIQLGGPAYTYSYTSNSNLIASITDTASGWTETMAYNATRDLLDSVDGQFSTAHKATFAYGYDTLGRRTSLVSSGEIFDRYSGGGLHNIYSYNDRSEVTAATGYTGQNVSDTSTASALGGRDFGYSYDPIGNRVTSSVGSQSVAYTPNSLNQYTQRTVPASAYVTGLAPASATVTVNGGTASRLGDYFYGTASQANTSAPQWLLTTTASSLGGSVPRYVFLAQTPENYSYDLDGNLTVDGRWTYAWDAENRLVSMETAAAAYTAGAPRQLLTFKYDYLGRRVRKTVANWNGSAYVAAVDRKFIYDGWNLLAEYDALTSFTLVRSYLWGLDLSRTLQDGGGVGGLLAVIDATTSTIHQAYYDGNGNVHALVNRASGAVTAAYEYSAFGETLRATGTFAQGNAFRFSSKYTDDESGLLYYGRRYYDPKNGRFLGRDPIEEKGGLHLYAFVRNSPTIFWDVQGQIPSGNVYVGWSESPLNGRPYVDTSAYWGGSGGGDNASGFDFGFFLNLGSTLVKTGAIVLDSLQSIQRARKCGELGKAINKAQAALDAYADHGGEAPDGSHRITADELSRLSSETLAKMDTKAGLSISVFVNDQGGYTVAYRGTEGFNLFGPDWKANEANALGFLSSQYSDAVDFAQAFVRAYGSNVDFSGHSLGGGLAAAAALKTGLTATTFNAAGVGAGTIDAKDLNTKNANGLITNYRNTFDPLTWGQESVIPLLPDALGRQKNVPMASLSTSGHSMDSMMSNLKTDFEKSGCDL